ncbi:PKD domain-containing protein [Algibacter mikhailovii]|uniref:PKD domain-containing protein n=1 Tax=Algibacter mikhailovii TaxID=425498 RepID=UPI0024958FFB|nr:PKD domain-containing protein [Algibacter mikhailovii]
MNFNIKIKKAVKFLTIIFVSTVLSCQPDKLGEGNGIVAPDMNAEFSVTPVPDANNTYELSATSSYITSNWDVGLGAGFYAGGDTEEVFYPDAGTYTIQHKVTGIGGASAIVSQNINVETSDPIAGNLIRGGKFQDASDHAEWTVLNISAGGAGWIFNEGSATIVASDWNQQGIYQAIEVVSGKEYKIDMIASGEGNNDTWFEVFASTVQPNQGSDYTSNVVMGLNTWAGCGTGSFSGLLSSVGCVENSYTSSISNLVTFEASGIIYLVIKCGGSQTAGITITNVEMRGTN